MYIEFYNQRLSQLMFVNKSFSKKTRTKGISLHDRKFTIQQLAIANLQFGNLATLQFGNLATWQFGSLAAWQFGNLAIWQLDNLATQEFGNLARNAELTFNLGNFQFC